MGYCVYEMPAVREAPPIYRPKIDRLVQQLFGAEPRQYGGFIPFFQALGQSWFKKRFGKYRLVAKLVPIQVEKRAVPVAVLVDLVNLDTVGDSSSEASNYEQRYAALLERYEQDIVRFAQDWLKQHDESAVWQPPSPPPAELLQTLAPLRPAERVDAFFVHRYFCRAFERLTLDSERMAVHNAMYDIANAEGSEAEGQLISRKRDKCVLYYVRLHVRQEGFKHVLVLGLISRNWGETEQGNEERKIQESWKAVQERILSLRQSGLADHNRDAISQFAERAFPDYLLADENLWQALWKPQQREVFLALSSEEVQTLESLLATHNLPAVIEGRAGSGKTTLLIYYTAERFTQLEDRLGQFLYLTQSEKLLERAKNLIECISKRLLQERGGPNNPLEPHYLTYHTFAVRQLLPERVQRFAQRTRSGRWIDFNHFFSLLRGHGAAAYIAREPFARSRDCNPEAVWFILRSYIKGYKITERGEDRWMPPEEYDESDQIPMRDRQVSTDLYTEVWKHIWPWYKKLTVPCPENDYEPPFWDDLDLAWEVLEHPRPDASEYAVLICDEVQDLTRVELAALLRSLSWARYDLSDLARYRGWNPGELRLPIIFAGDAHQTINPSVFRWERVSADLAEALVAHLPTLPRPKVGRLELEFNYRNARSIGELCNALQHLRQQTLGQKSRLQKLWNLPDHQPNQRIRKLIISGRGELRHLLQEGVLIIGPEDDDPNLEHTKPFWEALGCSLPSEDHPNYVTPVEIKGLEQENVAIAGFGVLWHLWLQQHRQLAHFWDWRKAAENPEIPEPLLFLVEYFLNRLYVAVSRACEQLWIIETQDGWNAFWGHLEQWLTRPSTPEPTDPPPLGSEGDIAELTEVFRGNWEELAKEFEQLAHDQKSPEHAERAAYYYDKLGQPIKRDIMMAWARYYDGSVLEAARKMIEMDGALGSDWFWEAAGSNEEVWRELVDPRIQPNWRGEIARCMSVLATGQKRLPAEQSEQVDRLTQLLELWSPQNREVKAEHRATWDKVYLRMVVSANGLSPEFLRVQQEAYDIASSWIPGTGSAREYYERLAGMAFALKKYKEAADHWEKAGRTDHKDYFIAKAESEQYPACLRWWESARDYRQIMLLYDTHGDVILNPDDRRRVGRAAEELQRWPTAFVMRAGLDNDRAAKDIWRSVLAGLLPNENLSELVAKLLREVHRSYAQVENPNFAKDWTHFLLDLMIESDNAVEKSLSEEERPRKLDQVLLGLVEAFSAHSDPEALRPRFIGSWNRRTHSDSNWPRFQFYLQQIVHHVQNLTKSRLNAQEPLRVARLLRFVLGLLWRFEKRERAERDEYRPHLRSFLLDYVVEEGEPKTETKTSTNYRQLISKDLQTTVQEALACIADLPENWLRSGESTRDHEPWKSLLDWVDVLAYDLHENLIVTLKASQSKEDVAPFEWWMLLGRFIEQAPFRRRARDFYRDLLRLSELYGWPHEHHDQIRQRLQRYEERYHSWKGRPRYVSEIYVNPGERGESDYLEVKSMNNKAEALVKFMPDEYQVRFQPPPERGGNPFIRWDPEVEASGPELIPGTMRWHVRCNTSSGQRVADLEWSIDKRMLYVRADREFVVSFAAPETLSS